MSGKLRNQFIGRGFAIGFVVGVNILAKGAAGGIKDNGTAALRIPLQLIFQKCHQHKRKAIEGIHHDAIGAIHRSQGIKRAKNRAKAVNENETRGHHDGFGVRFLPQ